MTVRILQGEVGIRSDGKRYTCRRQNKICAVCDSPVLRRGTKVKYCSHECYAKAITGVAIDPAVAASRRRLSGDAHPGWKGDNVSERGGRTRALRLFPVIGACRKCGAHNAERHHSDGNTANNSTTNIDPLCRRCHMSEDGRLGTTGIFACR